MNLLLSLLLAVGPGEATVRVRGADGGTLAVICNNCAAGTSWAPDGGSIGSVAVSNFPAPDGGYLGYVNAQLVDSGVAITNFPALQNVQVVDSGISVTNWPTIQNIQVVDSGISVLNFPATWAPDAGPLGSVIVTGSVISTFTNNPLNPFLPRCNPVRRTGCQP